MALHDDVPRWIAFPLARGAALESPGPADLRAPLQAWVELACVRMLCDAAGDLSGLPFTVESAMRLAMARPMDLEAWLDLYAALDHIGSTDTLGLPEPLPAEVQAAYTALGGAQDCTVIHLLQRLDEHAPVVEEVAAAAALARLGPWADAPLCEVLRVEPSDDGTHLVVDSRPLTGTGHVAVHRSTHAGEVPVHPGRLWFWDGADDAVVVPRWLARWDPAQQVLRLWNGRDPGTGHARYTTRHRPGDTATTDATASDLPPFLAEPAWSTPDPAASLAARDVNDDTAAFIRRDGGRAPTQAMALRRGEQPAPRRRGGQPAPEGARLILRVQSGPDLMRYVPLVPGHDVVLGRNQGYASFVLHHHQVSRSHTRVRIDDEGRIGVQDLKSTNGTHLNGRPVPTSADIEALPGDVVHVGPVPCRLEWATPEREARLQAVHALRDDEARRDPLTHLLRPHHLASELPEPLRATFRDGGEARAAPSLWGVLLYVDRLTAMHAQHGERTADRVFRSVARVLQASVDDPERWVRVGYGELLYPVVGVEDAVAASTAEQLVLAVQDHPWPDPIREVTLTGALAQKDPSASAQDWLHRMRARLQEGRSRHGRGRVYRVAD